MRRWLRQHGMVGIAHPWRVQVAVRFKRIRRARKRTGRGRWPCFICGYELLGLPSLTCPECGTVHEAAWYTGRFKAGGWPRQIAVIMCISSLWMGLSIGGLMALVALVLYRNSVSAKVTIQMPDGIVASGVTGAVSMVASSVVGIWVWRARRRLIWGKPRGVVVPMEFSVVCALLGWLAWSLLRTELPSV